MLAAVVDVVVGAGVVVVVVVTRVVDLMLDGGTERGEDDGRGADVLLLSTGRVVVVVVKYSAGGLTLIGDWLTLGRLMESSAPEGTAASFVVVVTVHRARPGL